MRVIRQLRDLSSLALLVYSSRLTRSIDLVGARAWRTCLNGGENEMPLGTRAHVANTILVNLASSFIFVSRS